MPEIVIDDPGAGPTIRQRIAARIAGDDLAAATSGDETAAPGFPWTYGEQGKRPIGSLFETEITDELLEDFYRRYQLGRRIVDDPIEQSIYAGLVIKVNGEESQKAMALFEKYKPKWLRFFKLVRLFGRSEMIFGWNDDPNTWANTKPAPGSKFTWLQPVPTQYEQELKVSETIPIKIEYLQVNFGQSNIVLDPSRFIHAMNPKLIDEDKEGESALLPVANLLQVQIHADWSIGQALWRRAGGLLGVYAPKRNVKEAEKTEAIRSVENYNAKTVVYVPFGWNVKEILKTSGNIAIQRTYKVILEQIAAGSGIPLSILIGQQKGGLTTKNEEDLETYYRLIGVIQNNMMKPTLHKFIRLGQYADMVESGPIEIEFNPLESKSELQKERERTELGALRHIQREIEENQVPADILVKLLTKLKK